MGYRAFLDAPLIEQTPTEQQLLTCPRRRRNSTVKQLEQEVYRRRDAAEKAPSRLQAAWCTVNGHPPTGL